MNGCHQLLHSFTMYTMPSICNMAKRARKMYSTKSRHRNLPDRNNVNCYDSKFYTTLEMVISA